MVDISWGEGVITVGRRAAWVAYDLLRARALGTQRVAFEMVYIFD